MTLLSVKNLTTEFVTRDGVAKAVDDVSFNIGKGRILGIVGESGSGKSVMAFSLMNLVDSPGRIAAGEICLDERKLHNASAEDWNALRGDRVAMVFQDPMMSLNPVMRIGDQLTETILIHRKISKKEAAKIACDALKRVGIPAPAERMRAYPHELSGGMRQRVAIANAIVNKPELIIADEPTTALDVTVQAQILYEMKALVRDTGMSLIWITHDLGVVKDLVDDLCVMYAGRIVEQGPVDQIISRPCHPYTKGLIESLPRMDSRGKRLYSIPGSTPPLVNLPRGCAFSPRCSYATDACATTPPVTPLGQRAYRCFHPLEAV